MNLEHFKVPFGTWFNLFEPFLGSPAFEAIMQDLRARTSRGKILFPYSSTLKKKCPTWDAKNTIFRCFTETPMDKTSVIFVGLSPYYTISGGKPIADGLAFSTLDKRNPPLLEALYNGIERDVYNGLNLNMNRESNLEFLAKQGVLLLNCALTCEPSMPTIHLDLWKPFMTYFFKKIVNNNFSNLNIVFWGDEAVQYSKLVNVQNDETFSFPNHHFIYKEHHPSFYARSGEIMNTNLFSQINKRLSNPDSPGYPIHWDTADKAEDPPF